MSWTFWNSSLLPAKRQVAAVSVASIILLCVAVMSTSLVQAKGQVPSAATDTIALTQLPVQGQDMMKLIYAGGPFKFDKDGVVFGNRERFLPAKNRGFYREYTVKTPGERTRGARRIVCGGLQPVAPEVCYYTDDHYASFRKIVQ